MQNADRLLYSFFDTKNKNCYRIQYAQKLMKEHPQMSITEVAEESGFSSRSAFYRNFKKMTGENPSEWLKELDSSHL